MNKYLQITTGTGIELVPIGAGIYAERTSATAMRLYSTSMGSLHHYGLVTVVASILLTSCIVDVGM